VQDKYNVPAAAAAADAAAPKVLTKSERRAQEKMAALATVKDTDGACRALVSPCSWP
jgi:hypothetical protein